MSLKKILTEFETTIEEHVKEHALEKVNEYDSSRRRGPCYQKFDYDTREITEDNQSIINQFKPLFHGRHVYIYTHKGGLWYKISKKEYHGYGEDFTGLGKENWVIPYIGQKLNGTEQIVHA